jgi:hypothetical protein
MTDMTIKVFYRACDGYRKTRTFKTIEGARKFAVRGVGENPEFGTNYAVSFDGIGVVEVEGCTLQELFHGKAKATGPYEVHVGIVNEDSFSPPIRYYLDRAFATLEEANMHAMGLVDDGADDAKIVGTTDEAKAAIQKQHEAYQAQMFEDSYRDLPF